MMKSPDCIKPHRKTILLSIDIPLNDIPIDNIFVEQHCSEGKPHASEVFCVNGGGIPTAIEGSRGRGPATESAVFCVFAKESARERLKNDMKLTPTGSRRKSNPDPRSWIRSAEGKVSLAQPFFSGKERLNVGMKAAYDMGKQVGQVKQIMAKEKAYKDAMFDVEYLTKAQSLDEVKKRLIDFGANGQDMLPNNTKTGQKLYKLTEQDLNYLFEMNATKTAAVYKDSKGNDISATLTAEEISEGLDISVKRTYEEYRDAMGVLYDPNTVKTAQPGPLKGGFYQGADGEYVQITVPDANGNPVTRYAKTIAANAKTTKFASYNLVDVLDISVNHGDALRDKKKAAYLAAGNALGDGALALKERDATYAKLFAAAKGRVDGGKEYSGYQITFEERNTNASAIFEMELGQRQTIQMKEWDLRQKDLDEAHANWEKKMDTILTRGTKAWTGVIDHYRQEWRRWEKEYDEQTKTEEKQWDDKVSKFFTDREAWKNQMSGLLAQKTVSVDMKGILENLNAQLATFEATVGTGFQHVDVQSQITQMVSAIKQTMPGSAEMLANVNDAINNFKTALSISELSLSNSIGAISGLSETFREKMREHAKNMKVLANVKAFEEFKKVKKSMIKQIELADERTAASTEASAASAGFVKVGNRFVKTGGTVMTTAFVDAYTRYNAEKNMTEQLENSGFAELNGDALVKFLSQSSDVEVESFFYVQKLALQVAFEKIMGKGSARDRANSRDERVIGLLGMWTGAMPDSTAITAATAASGNSYSSMNSRDRRNTISVVAGQGFGELGVWGTRPSGINGGFYVQLQMAGEHIAENQAQAVAEAGALDPISTFHAQLNPYGMMINSAYNVEMGSRVYGYDRGRLVNAQFMGAVKQVFTAVGPVLVAAGSGIAATGIGVPVGALAVSLGVAMTALGNSMHVNTQTGEYGTKVTDQAAIGTAVSIGGVFAGSGMLTSAGSSLVSSGMVYDGKGELHGFDLTGVRGDAALVTMTASMAGSYAGGLVTSGFDGNTFGDYFGKALVSGAVSTGVNTLSEFQKLKAYGSNYSNYAALGKADLTTGVGMLTSAYLSALGEQARDQQHDFRGNTSKDANRNDQNHRAATGLWGLYEGMRERFSAVGSTVAGWAGKIGSAISGAWNAFAGEGGFLEKAGNFLTNKGWQTDKAIRIAELDQLILKMRDQRTLADNTYLGFNREVMGEEVARRYRMDPNRIRESRYNEIRYMLEKRVLEGESITVADFSNEGLIGEAFSQLPDIRYENESADARNNRVLLSVRQLSEKLVFDSNETRNRYIGLVAEVLGGLCL